MSGTERASLSCRSFIDEDEDEEEDAVAPIIIPGQNKGWLRRTSESSTEYKSLGNDSDSRRTHRCGKTALPSSVEVVVAPSWCCSFLLSYRFIISAKLLLLLVAWWRMVLYYTIYY